MNFKRVTLGCFVLLLILQLSCTDSKKYEVETYLDPLEKEEQLWKIIRYIAKAPEGLLYEEKFYPGYDSFYRHQMTRHRFEAYYRSDDEHFFLVSRPAPSLVEKRVATGGRMKFDESGKLIEIEEVFRTWKMVPDTLKRRSMLLFEKMVKGEDLSAYLTKNSNGVDYIEFPDDLNYYDKAGKRWRQKGN